MTCRASMCYRFTSGVVLLMNVFNVDDSVPNIVPSPVTSACICALLFCNNYWLLLMPCILFIYFKTGCAKLYGTSINKNKMMHLVCNVNLLPCSFIHSTLIRIETLKELLQNKKKGKTRCVFLRWLVLGIRKLYNLWMLVRKPGQARKT